MPQHSNTPLLRYLLFISPPLGIIPLEKGVNAMSENEKKAVPPLPPVIAELLKQKGWSWPLGEENKEQIHDALDRFSGKTHVPEDLWDEVFEGVRGFENVRPKKDTA